jgi:hypothetical protein
MVVQTAAPVAALVGPRPHPLAVEPARTRVRCQLMLY